MMRMNYTVILEPANDGSISVYVPDLPGCVSCGDTREEAMANIADAIREHVTLLAETGQPVPPPHSEATVVAA